MGDFWKAVGENNNEDDTGLTLDDLGGSGDNLPAVPQFETSEPVPEEALNHPTSPQPSADDLTSSQSLSNVEEAQIDDPDQEARDNIKRASKRRPIMLGLIAVAVVGLGIILISGGKKDQPSKPPIESAPANPPSTANPPAVDNGDETAVDTSGGDTAVETTEPEQGQSRSYSKTRVNGIISPKERAKGEKLLNQAEAWIQDADHPADGKTGKLKNNGKQMAALMSQELPFKVVTGGAKPGQVQLMLNREMGLCLLITPVGKEKISMLRRVKIYVTGISALRDQK